MSERGDNNLQQRLEQEQKFTIKNPTSSERLAQFHREDEQLAALQRGSDRIDAEKIATASHEKQSEQHLERREHDDEELLALQQEVLDIQKEIAAREDQA